MCAQLMRARECAHARVAAQSVAGACTDRRWVPEAVSFSLSFFLSVSLSLFLSLPLPLPLSLSLSLTHTHTRTHTGARVSCHSPVSVARTLRTRILALSHLFPATLCVLRLSRRERESACGGGACSQLCERVRHVTLTHT